MTPAALNDIWYGERSGIWLLPLAWLYGAVVRLRRWAYRHGFLHRCKAAVPVIVVGNISVGGTGKTPLVIWLVERLVAAGHRPAVISRGYRSTAGRGPVAVTATATAAEVGDEPLMIARRTNVPVFVGSDRCGDAVAAVRAAATIIVTDDGLQHYRLRRDLELAVVDGEREFGNRRLLPAGPLREPLSRIDAVDMVLRQVSQPSDDNAFWLRGDTLVAVHGNARQPLAALAGKPVVAVAGVGNPERFFDRLRAARLGVTPVVLDDHAPAAAYPLEDYVDATVIVTEKDAVKLGERRHKSLWYLPVEAELSKHATKRLDALLAPLLPANPAP